MLDRITSSCLLEDTTYLLPGVQYSKLTGDFISLQPKASWFDSCIMALQLLLCDLPSFYSQATVLTFLSFIFYSLLPVVPNLEKRKAQLYLCYDTITL